MPFPYPELYNFFLDLAMLQITLFQELKQQMNNCRGLVRTKLVKSFNLKFNVLASVVPIGMVLGGLVGGYLAMRCGPKKMMQVSCLVNVLGWVSIAASPHLALLIMGRFICGLGSSMASSNMSLLVAQYR